MTSKPVVLFTFCFVEEALLTSVSVELWINGVPRPSGNWMLLISVVLE